MLFASFFDAVQDAAKAKGKVFFMDTAQGREFETPEMAGDDLSGWLVPESDADAFELQWLDGWDAVDERFFDDCFVWAVWSEAPTGIEVSFKRM